MSTDARQVALHGRTRDAMDRRRWTATLVVAVTLLVYLAVVLLTVRHYGDNISALIGASDAKGVVIPHTLGHHVVVYHGYDYDGMAYYYVAADPFLQHPLLRNAFRYQRVAYPVLVWALSFGRLDWRPAAMVGVNLLAVLAVAILSLLLLQQYAPGASPWWALACAVNPMLIIGVQRDLTEPVMVAFALAGLLLYLRRRIGRAAALFAAALLAREVAVLFLLPLLVAEVIDRRPRQAVVLALALLPYVVWQLVLWHAFGRSAASTLGTNVAPPFRGILDVVAYARHTTLGQRVGWLILFGLVVFDVVALASYLGQATRKIDVVIGGVITHAAAALCGSFAIWIGYASAARVFGGLYPLSVLAYARYRTTPLGVVAAGTILFTLVTLARSVVLAPVYPYHVTP